MDAATIALVGISHHTASIELRERVHVDSERLEGTVRRLLASREIHECVVLSTCNRTELYLNASEPEPAQAAAIDTLASLAGLAPQDAEAHLYRLFGFDTVLHLFRVAAGLDSLVVGEAEILGQVGDAYESGRALPESVGPVLHRLFQSAQAIGGAVRSETRLGQGAASIPSAAVQLAIKVFGSLEGRRSMVLGAGEMGIATLRCLLAEGVSDVRVANRTLERARATVAEIGGEAVSMDGFWDALPDVDILVTSTASARPVVDRVSLARARLGVGSPLVILDIAVPRDVDPDVGSLSAVFLYNIDDLQKVVGAAEAARRDEIGPAEQLVREHATRFWRWYRSREIAPLIRGLREHAEAVRSVEVERLLAGLQSLDEADRERIERATRRLLNKLMHPSTVALRRAASDPGGIDFLFRLGAELGLDPNRSGLETGGEGQDWADDGSEGTDGSLGDSVESGSRQPNEARE